MSIHQQCLMQVRKPSGDCASVAATTHDQHTHFVVQQFGMNMVCFHSFIVHVFSRRIPEAFACCRPETSLGNCAYVLPGLTTSRENRPGGLLGGQRHLHG